MLDQGDTAEEEDELRQLAKKHKPGKGSGADGEEEEPEKLESDDFLEKIAPMLFYFVFLVYLAIFSLCFWTLSRIFKKLRKKWNRFCN